MLMRGRGGFDFNNSYFRFVSHFGEIILLRERDQLDYGDCMVSKNIF